MAQCGTCVARLYKTVVEEVITGIRESFLDEGIDEQVLADLKQQWEAKLASSKASEHNELTLHHQQQASQQHAAPATTAQQQSTQGQPNQSSSSVAQMALVPVQITVPSQQAGGVAKTITIHVPSNALSSGVAGTQLQNILSSPAAAHTFSLEASQAAEIIQRQLNVALQQHGVALPPTLLQYNHSNVTQVDGPADALPDIEEIYYNNESGWSLLNTHIAPKATSAKASTSTPKSPHFEVKVPTDILDQMLTNELIKSQVDGAYGLGDSSDEITDDDDDDDEEEDKDDDKKIKDDDEEDEEEDDAWNDEPLNSDDDVSEDEGADTFETENVIVCQYDKVTRVRNKWKFHLKDGIMNLKGKDYVFTKATGEGEW